MELLHARIRFNDKEEIFPAGKMTFFDECYLDFKASEEHEVKRYQITIHPKQNITVQAVELICHLPVHQADRVFCNGYQSWSESREFSSDEFITDLRFFAKNWLQYAGDQQFKTIQTGKGFLHSWNYTYRRNKGHFDFWASLREDTCFTIFQYNLKKEQLIIRADIEELTLQHSYPVMDIMYCKGTEEHVFDTWIKLMAKPFTEAPKLKGWTSWYQHYTNISEEIILDNLEAFTEEQIPIQIIQIDDGFQTSVGDWLSIKNSFPNGMASVADKIHEKGLKAGLWLAPFVCDARSDLFRKNPDWLLKDQQGKPVKAGYNPLWGGWFYALDFYHKQVQEYLTGVFFTILHKWNYDLLKLDFLYAACLYPPPDKTRGQVMHEAMEFLRKIMGKKWMLACGVPLGAAFHCADYCRIGADIHLKWEHSLLNFLKHRERVSTKIALRSTIGRWQLNNRVFHNDPDVFILRTTNNKLTENQQYSILLINRLLGNLLFTSDNPLEYKPEQKSELELLFDLEDIEVTSVKNVGQDQYIINYEKNENQFVVYCNLQAKPWNINGFELEAYESIIRR